MSRELLQRLIGRSRRMDQARFARVYSGTYLLCTSPEDPRKSLSFTTGVISPEDLLRVSQGKEQLSLDNITLCKIEKTDRNPWKRHISIGRAPNNDVVIRHHSVSKLHAHIRYATYQGTAPDEPTPLLLEDAGSANGTLMGAQPLDPGVAVIIRDGSQVTFGEVTCEVLEAPSLFVALRSLDP